MSGIGPFARAWIEGIWWQAAPVPAGLAVLAALHGRIVAWRQRRALDRPPPPLAVPVVVVGNLVVGGTGKTPAVEWVAGRAAALGLRVGVVSRGYGGRPPVQPFAVQPGTPAALAGDEAVMLARRLGVPVVIGADRAGAVRALLAAHPVDLVISDDGLQHAGLRRDLGLVVFDGERGAGNGRLLPAGPLREPLAALAGADRVLNTGQPCADPRCRGDVLELQPTALRSLDGREAVAVAALPADPRFSGGVHGFAGIGHPARFFAALRGLGLVVTEHAGADHVPFSARQLAVADGRPVVMTHKDAVRMPDPGRLSGWWLDYVVSAGPAAQAWLDTALRRLCAAGAAALPASKEGAS